MSDPQRADEFERVAVLLGEKVRARREELGLTQEELGHRVGMDRKGVQNVEYGRSSTKGTNGRYGVGNPKLDTIYRLATVLHVGLDYLVDPRQPVRSFGD